MYQNVAIRRRNSGDGGRQRGRWKGVGKESVTPVIETWL